MHTPSPVNSSPTIGTPDFDPEAARHWLETLHGSSTGLIHICSTGSWTGQTFRTDEIDQAVRFAQLLDRSADEGIYVRTTTLNRRLNQGERGSVEDSYMLPGFALDIDLAGPGHKTDKRLPETVEDAQNILAHAEVPQPTLWVHSGGGVYPWWLFEQPIDIRNPEDRDLAQYVVRGLQRLVKDAADRLGWHFGTGVIDLARVLRLPGSVNRKAGGARPCRMIEPAPYVFHDYAAFAGAVLAAPGLHEDASPVESRRPAPTFDDGNLRPGEAMELAWGWEDILPQHGWRRLGRMGRGWRWQRPGKEGLGLSATTGMAADRDRLFVFSTEAAPFECSFDAGPYNKFAAYAKLEHGGDFSAAGRALRALGFGSNRPGQQNATNPAGLVRPDNTGGSPAQVEVVGSEQVKAVEQVGPALCPVVLDHDGLPQFSEDILARHKWRDRGIIDMYLHAFSPGLRFVASEDEWMIWDGKRWKVDQLGRSKYAAQKLLAAIEDTADRLNAEGHEHGKAMIDAAKKVCTFTKMSQLPNLAKSQPAIAAELTDFDISDDLVTVDNGILNLATGILTPHDPSKMITKKLNAPFDPSARCERFDKFLTGVMPNPEVLSYVQRCAAATLFGRADERIVMFLYGESGTGKSAFLEMLVEVFGDYAAIADEQTFKPDNDYKGPTDRLHKLKGSRLVKMSELQEGAVLNQSLIKNITGMDKQSTRPLYGKLVEWKVQYVAWLATNHLPRLSSNDGAIWKRVKPIHFGQSFVDSNGEALNRNDRGIGQQLAKSSAAAILNWLLEGLADYRANGLQEPAVIGQWLNTYRDEVDTTRQFVVEAADAGQIEVAEGRESNVRELYRVYTAWCADNQVKPVAANNFNLRMETNGWVKVRKERGTLWQGIGVVGFIAQAQLPVGGPFRRRE